MPDPLIIVGASVRAAAFSARRAGFEPLAVDRFADRDLRACCAAVRLADFDHAPQALRTLPPAPWMYTGAMENRPSLIERLARRGPLLGNRAAVLARARDPARLGETLRQAGLAFPETHSTPSAPPHDGPWLRKRRRSSGGCGIVRWDGQAPSEQHYLQRFVAGPTYGACYIAVGGRAVLLGASRQLVGSAWCGASGFLYAGSIGAVVLPESIEVTLRRIGDVLAGELELVGLIGVDVIIDDQTVWTLEVNPRYSASLEVLERSLDLSSIDLHVAACRQGRLPDRSPCPTGVLAGKAVLYARRDLTIGQALSDHLTALNADRLWPDVADIPCGNMPVRRGAPVVTVFAEGASESEVETRLQQRAADLERLLYA